jgi:pilus assembly protein CpaE
MMMRRREGSQMIDNDKSHVFLVTSDPQTASAVCSSLDSIGHFKTDGVCRDLDELVARLEEDPGIGVLVDIDPEPRRGLSQLDPVISQFPDTRFIVLSSEYSAELVLEAMQVGARHFVRKQSIAPELAGALRRLMPVSTKDGKRGSIITLLSASGGCGTTTLAINLANELHLASKEPALLVDLDSDYGALATYLGVEGQYGIRDVLADRTRIDAQLVNTTTVAYSNGLHVLINPASTELADSAPLEYDNLAPALEACKEAYHHIVIDAPRVPMAVAAKLAQASVLTLVVFQLNVKEVQATRRILLALPSQARVFPLANRHRKRKSMVSLKEAETALGGVTLEHVGNDFRAAIRGLNYGKPLSDAAPRSVLRRDLRRLVGRLYGNGLGQ